MRAAALPCPECRSRNIPGLARIGNRRRLCATCNNFAQNVMRITRQRLRDRHPEEYEVLRFQVEADLYPQVLEDFVAAHPQDRQEASDGQAAQR